MKVIYLVVVLLLSLAAAALYLGGDQYGGVTQLQRDASNLPVLRNLNLASLFQKN
jgi:hypothetical protein